MDGAALEEDYVNEPTYKSYLEYGMGLDYPVEVPEGSVFVMGDNRNNSLDSRYWENTYVTKDAILAKAGFRYWPLNQIGTFKDVVNE